MFKKKQNPKEKIMYYACLQSPGYVTGIYESLFTIGLLRRGTKILYSTKSLRKEFFKSFKENVSIKCCHSKKDIIKKHGDGSFRLGFNRCGNYWAHHLQEQHFVYKLTVKQNEEEICLDEVEKVKNDIIYTSDVKFTDVTKIEYLDSLENIYSEQNCEVVSLRK